MRRPRVGFLGVGWIGRHRMQALIESTLTEPVAICEPDDTAAAAAMELAPAAVRTVDLEALLQQDLDGLVIATPSALACGPSHRCLAGRLRSVFARSQSAVLPSR